MLFDVEAPDYDEARAFMTARQALRGGAALRGEGARLLRRARCGEVRDPEVRALFEELRDEEVQHQDLVGRELAKLPPETEGELDPEDFTDEPTSQ